MEFRKYVVENKYLDYIYMRTIRPIAYLLFLYPIELFRILLIRLGIDRRYEYLREYKDIHRQRRCFILGTGPSLKKNEYKALGNEITLGCNALCLWFANEKNTTYFFCSDRYAYEKLENNIPNGTFVTSYVARKLQLYKNNRVKVVNNSRYNFFCDWSHKVSDDIVEVTYDFNSVVFFAIQFAIYTGIKEIYLLGVDCNYNKTKIYAVDHGIRHRKEYMNDVGYKMIENFQFIKKYCDERGIKIYNASQGGMLEVFERVDLEKVLNIT